jgi:hypothetical protein
VPRHFPKESLVIGYKGPKTIVIDKSYEEIDEYTMVDVLFICANLLNP